MTKKNKPKSRETKVVVQNLENETLVYDLRTNQAFCLNETSSEVWQYCNGQNSIAEISNLLSKKLKTLVSEDFVLLALNELHKNNLLEREAEFNGYLTNLNRREMAKRIGLTSMVALPMISAVVAPTAANAQSGACLTDNQPISCEVTITRIGNGECVPFTVIAPNAWLCSQPACCSGDCINVDPAVNSTTGVCS